MTNLLNTNKFTNKVATDSLKGSVERVTFHSEQTGFCVLRTKVKGQQDLVTVVGNTASITVGEYIECQGYWVNDFQHGLQFKASNLVVILPTTLEGIKKYLASGMIKGIGPHFAEKLIQAFGDAVFDVIESEPERLTTLEGIGEKRKELVVAAWAEQKVIRHIMVFLQSHGVGAARAVRIYKTYGDKAIDIVRSNPYRLSLDIWGIGFKTADQLAMHLGIDKKSLIRAQAGVRHVLQELCDYGHCAASFKQLINASHQLLEIEPSIIEEAIFNELHDKRMVQETIHDELCLYPISLYQAEVKSAFHLKRLQKGELPWGTITIDKALYWLAEKTHLLLSPSQKHAIKIVLTAKLSIITGGPGVGKTTLVNSLLMILYMQKLRIALCAPTGRAAKRLTETTNMPAKTIHRLLSFDPTTFGFKYNHENELPVDVVIIDESSMIDIVLLNHLLKAIPNDAAVIFVGDIDQLPSVGPGAVLADMIHSNAITTVRLTEVFRQAANSKIILNAHRINQGHMPLPNTAHDCDFYTLYVETPEELCQQLLDIVCIRLPQRYHYNAMKDIQVLTPMNRGNLGSRSLNVALQQQLNGHAEPKMTRFGVTFAPGDKVIQMVNNYNKDVFNGDIGFIERIDKEENVVTIRFDQGEKDYEASELDELQLAYAISIHKSQGSEFPVVVIPLSTQHYTLLARNLLYTAITRGKRLVVLIGQKKAIAMAINNNRITKRLTKLADRLQEV